MLKDLYYLIQKSYEIWQGFGSLMGSSHYTNMIFLGTSAAVLETGPEYSYACKCGVGGVCPRVICVFKEKQKTLLPLASLYPFMSCLNEENCKKVI